MLVGSKVEKIKGQLLGLFPGLDDQELPTGLLSASQILLLQAFALRIASPNPRCPYRDTQ